MTVENHERANDNRCRRGPLDNYVNLNLDAASIHPATCAGIEITVAENNENQIEKLTKQVWSRSSAPASVLPDRDM